MSINSARRAAGVPEHPTAEQTGTDPVGERIWAEARAGETPDEFLHRAVRERLDDMLALPAEEGSMEQGPMHVSAGMVARQFGQPMRELTSDEIRHQELSELLGYIEGDPIDGSPKRKEIMAAIRHRLGVLRGPEVKAQFTTYEDARFTSSEDAPAPDAEDPLAALIRQIEGMNEQVQRVVREDDRRAAIEVGMELLRMDDQLTDDRKLVDPGWRKTLATTIAVNLVGIIATE